MLDEEAVRKMVRRVVYRTLGLPQGSSPVAARPLITEADVRDLPIGAELSIPQGALVTPLARQIALERKLTLREAGAASRPGRGFLRRCAVKDSDAGTRGYRRFAGRGHR